MTKIKWKTIPSFADYEVSEFGEVRRRTATKRTYIGRLLSPMKKKQVGAFGDSYIYYNLHSNGQKKQRCAHQLVAEAFLGKKPQGAYGVLHKDGTRSNNHYSNLCWGSHTQNMKDVADMALLKGSKAGSAKLTEAQVLEIRNKYSDRSKAVRLISQEYGVSENCITSVLLRRSWRHI